MLERGSDIVEVIGVTGSLSCCFCGRWWRRVKGRREGFTV
jgi:hypothetical protein